MILLTNNSDINDQVFMSGEQKLMFTSLLMESRGYESYAIDNMYKYLDMRIAYKSVLGDEYWLIRF